jgi:hypothetical protein
MLSYLGVVHECIIYRGLEQDNALVEALMVIIHLLERRSISFTYSVLAQFGNVKL